MEEVPASLDMEVSALVAWSMIGTCVLMDVVREKFRDIRHKHEKSH